MTYKILWYTTPALHDNSNGGAKASRIMLEALVRRGISVTVLCTSTSLESDGFKLPETVTPATDDNKILHFTDKGVEYFIVQTLSP